MLMMPLAAQGESKRLETGANWVVEKNTSLSNLTIAKGVAIKAPDKHSITMTVNHVETAIEPGTYQGDIMLTVTDDVKSPIVMEGGPEGGDGGAVPGGAGDATGIAGEGASGGPGGVVSGGVRTAIYVDGGVYVPEKSVPAAVATGTVTNTSAKNVSISSRGKNFDGIIITGDSTYSISNLKINFDGGDQGDNGAAITSSGKADVIVNKASIMCKGVQRAAIVVGGNSTIHVNDSDIETYDGKLLEKYAGMEDSNSMEVPWVLGFIGNNRATNVVQNGTAYYNNTHVRTQRWGCLSTDMAQSVKLYATNCHLEAIESGYGAYSIGNTSVTEFKKCKFDVHDYGLIMAGGSGTFADGCVVNSGRFGVMVHSSNTGTLTIDSGCVFNTEKAVIQIKSAYPDIIVDNAKLNSKNGVILEAVVNDDPWLPAMAAKMPAGFKSADANRPVNATFKNMSMDGDIIDAMTTLTGINITFENATITGAITTATSKAQADIDGVKISKKTYYYVGAVKNTYCATEDKHGLKVSLDGKSKWVVTKTSYLTNMTIAKGACIDTPEGFKVAMTVNGVPKPIKAGDYEGKIVLVVTKL